KGSASQPMSGTCRIVPARLAWKAGLVNVRLVPPPAPNWTPRPSAGSLDGGTMGGLPSEILSAMRVRLLPQPVSNLVLLSGFRNRLVAPTLVAQGGLPGQR